GRARRKRSGRLDALARRARVSEVKVHDVGRASGGFVDSDVHARGLVQAGAIVRGFRAAWRVHAAAFVAVGTVRQRARGARIELGRAAAFALNEHAQAEARVLGAGGGIDLAADVVVAL